MKKTIFVLLSFLSICLAPAFAKAQQKVSVTFKFVTINTISGYDHVSKLLVYCDDDKIGESSQKLQSVANSITVKVPKGNHTVKAELWALYKGTWEVRTLANNYSFDFEYTKTGNWKVNNTIDLTFDINDEVVNVTEKIPVTSDDDEEVAESNTKSKGSYATELAKINKFLKTFDDGYYGYLEIIDGYLYDRFKSGKYSKSEIKYLGTAYEDTYKRKVVIPCTSSKECVYSTYTDSYHKTVTFSQSTDFNTSELITLLNNLLDAYKGVKSSKGNDNDDREENAKSRQKTVKTTKPPPPPPVEEPASGIGFKKGDKIKIVDIYSYDKHYDTKSKYIGKTGTIITIDYDDWDESYFGKVKLSTGETVEFNDFLPELVKGAKGN
ncbi:hypothetical protein ACQ33O_10850 [Ferruginibacter sp. SUN002]|uniref:hypothetical protein n=1 Tax=Ferruginibacter sp. SUN002 TaxID=2937789 RepID=UPI003D35DA62